MPDFITPAATAIGAFGTFLPNYTDVRRARSDNVSMANDVHTGEISACVVTLGIGLVVAFLTKSRTPIIVAIIACVLLVVVYESTLRSHPAEITQGT